MQGWVSMRLAVGPEPALVPLRYLELRLAEKKFGDMIKPCRRLKDALAGA